MCSTDGRFSEDKSVDILAQAWLAPARCCLIDPDEPGVEIYFAILKKIAEILREEYQLLE